MKAIQINEKDNVAVALKPLAKGKMVEIGEHNITVREEIPQGHKFALQDISEGADVIKYGLPIGHTTQPVGEGMWVHTHNLETNLKEKTEYTYQPELQTIEQRRTQHFYGYRRKDGRVGIRNDIWIIPTVGCVNEVALRIAQENQDLLNDDIGDIYALTHPYGCSQTGEDHERTKKLLAALACHPNAGAVLIVGLGCENLTKEQLEEEMGDYDKERVQFLICQDVEDEHKTGRLLLRRCVRYASKAKNERFPASELIVGLKCGGSDGLSGITANPVIGRMSDLIIRQGGTTILTEVPEMFGAEEVLLKRCANEEVFEKAVRMIDQFKDYLTSHNEVIYENPSPGNKQGGITTLEDKSCGCVQKGGIATITDVIGYGETVTKTGLNLMYGPGNDMVSVTALAAAGAQLVVFSTGRGTPFGGPVPTIKVSTNSHLAQYKEEWIDFDAGTVVNGEPVDEVAGELLDLLYSIADGRPTMSEMYSYHGIAILKDGVTL